MHPLRKDPWFAAQLEEALAQHRGALTPRQIEAFCEKMAWTFENHPAAQRILQRDRPSEYSGERLKEGVEAVEAVERKSGGGST